MVRRLGCGHADLELHHMKNLQHSDGMPIALLPKERILFTADLMKTRRCHLSLIGAIAVSCGLTLAARQATRAPARAPDAVYIPTPREVVTSMLRMAHVGKDDVVYDLGSGDGRIVIAAVKEFGAARGVGIEIDGARVEEANENARRAGVKDRVEFRRQDLFDTNLSDATVVALYLTMTVTSRLRPKLLAELKPGARIVSHAFGIGDWVPAESRIVSGRMVYLWTVPLNR
jgi:methylase of polypeptide subunit release factors